jgi:hypothetical protein
VSCTFFPAIAGFSFFRKRQEGSGNPDSQPTIRDLPVTQLEYSPNLTSKIKIDLRREKMKNYKLLNSRQKKCFIF